MNALLNRFFVKNESVNDVELMRVQSGHPILDFLFDKATFTSQLEELKAEVNTSIYSVDSFQSQLELVQQYLEVEWFLIYKDPNFIGPEQQVREELRAAFPEITNLKPFKPLFEEKKNQEISFYRNFLRYVLGAFQSQERSEEMSSRWLNVLESRPSTTHSAELVNQIHTLRRLKDYSREIYKDFVDSFGKDWINNQIIESHKEFISYYKRIKAVNCLNDLLPECTTSSETTTAANLSIPRFEPKPVKSTLPLVVSKKEIFENMLDGFMVIDSNGKIIDYNSAALNFLSLTSKEIKTRRLFDLLPLQISDALKEDLEKNDPTIPNKVIGKRLDQVVINCGGKQEYFEVSMTNNYTEEADTYSVFLKNISDSLDSINAMKEAKVNAERTAKAKSTFLSNMSHEIRTPLNVILGLSEIIKKSDLNEPGLLRKNLECIDFSAKNLLSIVNDILDFSKIEAGKLSIQSIDYNLRKLVDNLAEGFKIKAEEKGLTLVSSVDKELPDIVIGDQYRLNQTLTNLVSNAIKFTKDGKISIDVNLVSQKDDKIYIKFKVEDTGIGIPKAKLDRIFDSFYQIDDHENLKVTGTGLGLTITKELIRLQDGQLDASSVVSKGSVFEFILPFRKSNLKGLNESETIQVRHDKSLKGLKVLVAEDNQMNQFYIKQLLNKLEVEVDIAENGQEAVNIYENSNFEYDLILMDMHMPIMNGIEAITVINQSNKYSLKKVPIVACSADVFPEARKNAIKAGIDFYLTKPLSEDAIKEVLFWLISDKEFDIHVNSKQINSQNAENSLEKSVDMAMLRDTFDNDEEFITSLLDIFIKTTPEDYKSLRACMDREYYIRASSLAHKLKSSFMNLGMTTHGHHLQQIESHLLKKDGVAEAKKHLSAFSSLYTRALLEVNILLIELKQK